MCHNFQYVLQTSTPERQITIIFRMYRSNLNVTETLNSFSAYILSKCMCTAGSKLDTLDCPRASRFESSFKRVSYSFCWTGPICCLVCILVPFTHGYCQSLFACPGMVSISTSSDRANQMIHVVVLLFHRSGYVEFSNIRS
jgi:hypothetical protein